MKITAITFSSDKIKIDYLSGENELEENRIGSSDLPRPEFEKALKDLIQVFHEYYELDETLKDKLHLSKVKFHYFNQNKKNKEKIVYNYRIWATLEFQPGYHAFATIGGDYLEIPEAIKKDDKITLNAKTIGDAVQEQALKYISGDRAQTVLPLSQKK